MYDSYFQTCATLLVCRRQGASCPTDTFVFYLYLLTVNLIIHTSMVILEKSPIAVLKLTTAGLPFF